MKKIILLFGILVLISTAIVSAECNGCLKNDQCYNIGDISNNSYCSLSKLFISQKSDNSSCQNNFECISNYCMDEICINQQVLIDLNIDLTTINQTEEYLKQGACTATPGCLNQSSLANAQNVSGICVQGITFKCFQCNASTPYWNGSVCTMTPCNVSPGCMNLSKLSELDNYENISAGCSLGFKCIKCKRDYPWNGSSCRYSSTTSSTTTSTAIVWTTNSSFTEDSIKTGFIVKLKSKERIKIIFNGIEYYIGIINLTTSSVTLNISSRSQPISLNLGDRSLDITNDGIEDITLTISSITSSQATIFIKTIPTTSTTTTSTPGCTEGQTRTKSCPGGSIINTEICENGRFVTTDDNCIIPPETSPLSISNNLIWIIMIISIILAIIIIILVLILSFLKQNKSRSIFTNPINSKSNRYPPYTRRY